MWKLAMWGGLGFLAVKLFSKSTPESSARVTWTDSTGARSRDFAKASVADDFASSLTSAGAKDVQIVKMAA